MHSENGLAFQTIYSTTTIRKNKETQLVIYAQMYACISLPFISPLVFFGSHMFLIGPRGGGKKRTDDGEGALLRGCLDLMSAPALIEDK